MDSATANEPASKPFHPTLRILPAESDMNSNGVKTMALVACQHCGVGPLIIRKCGERRTCGVCCVCGAHVGVNFNKGVKGA